MSQATIRLIEELAANAWPAEIVQVVDGWRLRFNWGTTRRANSVWPNEAGGAWALDDKLAVVEDFYARRQTPARFQMCPAAQPTELDDRLAARGYRLDAPTLVQTANLAAVLSTTESRRAWSVEMADSLSDTWFDTYRQVEQIEAKDIAGQWGILQRIRPATGYALATVDGQAAAVGLGVLERGWVGVFCMGTRTEFQRRGAAKAVLNALAAWGQAQGATQMYLQVMAKNQAAIALYEGVGFATTYQYHYREQTGL